MLGDGVVVGLDERKEPFRYGRPASHSGGVGVGGCDDVAC